MRFNRMDEFAQCSICGRTLQAEWQPLITQDDGSMEYGWSIVEDYILAESDGGEIHVCMKCYPQRAEQVYSGQQLAEIHYQRGLALYGTRRDEARRCLLKAVALMRSADYLAALAITAKTREEYEQLCREALASDPDHLIARLNLDSPPERFK